MGRHYTITVHAPATDNYQFISAQVRLSANFWTSTSRYLSQACGYFHMFAPHCDNNQFSHSHRWTHEPITSEGTTDSEVRR